MINNTLTRKLVAGVTAAVMLLISSQVVRATPGVRGGALSLLGAVEVNGEKAISGGTVFSDSAIVTREQSGATINFGRKGRVALLANSILKLSFTDTGLKGCLDAGEARVSTPAGVSVSLITPAGVVLVDGSEPTDFTVTTRNGETNVAATMGSVELTSAAGCALITAGEDGLAGGIQNQPRQGHSRKALAALLVAIGGAVAAAIWIVTHDSEPHADDMTFGGTVIIPSGGPR
jgi:ferric-dicitrate binding protein FerR (iron transport regulator)